MKTQYVLFGGLVIFLMITIGIIYYFEMQNKNLNIAPPGDLKETDSIIHTQATEPSDILGREDWAELEQELSLQPLEMDQEFSSSPLKPEPKRKKFGFNYGLDDSTGLGDVRAKTVTAGVDYNMTERASLGVAAGRKIYDSEDAAAWDQTVEDENTAQVKYKLSF